jgi:osmoprotectant transport system substrate-binding protein/osmoprotectant transport system permease protein
MTDPTQPMVQAGRWSRELAELPELLSAHVRISALAAGLAVLIGVPTAVLVARRPRARAAVLGVVGVVQTIPGLALLALMVPLLGAFGFWPALSALILYALLPIVRNTVTGIDGVDAAVLEAADGMGMTPLQRLTRVELPLALPVIVAGVRTAMVWTVGMATLGTPVGQPSLGSYIFGGLQTRNTASVLVGCVAAALLALVLDALLALLDASLARRRRAGVWLSLGGVFVVVSAACLAPGAVASVASARPGAASTSRPAATATPEPTRSVVHVGAKTFTEQYILASAIAQRLIAAGESVERHESLGSTVAFDALRNGDIDVYVEYTGTIWSSYMQRGAPESGWRTLALAGAWLAENHGIRLLGPLGFENAYCLAMRRERAEALGVHDLRELASHASELALGTDYELRGRPEWARLTQAYGLSFARLVTYDPSFMYSALARGDVDVISAFSSDGRIDSLGLVVLGDPAHAFPPYDAVLLLSPRAAQSESIVGALTPLLGAIPVARMRRANELVDRSEGEQTAEQAARWLLEGLPSRAP